MLNRIVLIGRLTADPELRYTNSGSAVVARGRGTIVVSSIQEANGFRNHLGHTNLLTLSIFIGTDLQATIDGSEASLVQVLRARFGLLLPYDDVDEIRLAFPVLVWPRPVHGQRKRGHGGTGVGVPKFGVCS